MSCFGGGKGQFYTPAEVSRIMAQVVGIGADRPSRSILGMPFQLLEPDPFLVDWRGPGEDQKPRSSP